MKSVLVLCLLIAVVCAKTLRSKSPQTIEQKLRDPMVRNILKQKDVEDIGEKKIEKEKSRKSMDAASNATRKSIIRVDKKLDKIVAATHEDADARILIHRRRAKMLQMAGCKGKRAECSGDKDNHKECCSGHCKGIGFGIHWAFYCE